MLFRSVKGPANHIKDGIQPLEGIVETDWLMSTFTMNWKLTRICEWVSFKKDEPFCMLVPLPRGLPESLIPKRVPIVRVVLLTSRPLACALSCPY